MARIGLIFLGLVMSLGVKAQTTPADNHNHGVVTNPTTPTIEVFKFKVEEHDFGKIPQGKPVYYSFEFVNTGQTAMKLENVSASCGCTTPEWSQDAVEPGATAKIRVGYNAAVEGSFEKPITITYNNNQTKQIKIKGMVWKAPEGSAPVNASVDFLKKQTF